MIVEYIRYRILKENQQSFEDAYAEAATSLQASEHCLFYELSHGVEDPENYILRIEWDSQEGHERGFRNNPEFKTFFRAVKPFFDNIEEMRHYAPTVVRNSDETAH